MSNLECNQNSKKFPTVFYPAEIQSLRDWVKKHWPEYLDIERKRNILSPKDMQSLRANRSNNISAQIPTTQGFD